VKRGGSQKRRTLRQARRHSGGQAQGDNLDTFAGASTGMDYSG